jgi:hypothetical protein
MRYVIIRDDDTNALTPVDCLERLYRPFLERGLPVNLATIPEVATNATRSDGRPEGFLLDHVATAQGSGSANGRTVPIADNPQLVSYLRDNSGFHIVQHGCHHEYLEFDRQSSEEISRRLERGTRRLLEAGFPRPQTFVAPYDKLSRAGLRAVAKQFRVLSTGWFELRRLPCAWWPRYVLKKLRHWPHWRIGGTVLLSHPGCLLSCERTYSTMLGGITHYLENQQLTVLVTHWWEYFREGRPDGPFIDFLHETANYLATHPQLKVVSFDDLVTGNVPLN